MSRNKQINSIKKQMNECINASYDQGFEDGFDKGYKEAQKDMTKFFNKTLSNWICPDELKSEKCLVAEELSNKPRSCLNCLNCLCSCYEVMTGEGIWECTLGNKGSILGDTEKQVASRPTCNFYRGC